MKKITFDLDAAYGGNYTEFKTQADYDADSMSSAGHLRECSERDVRSRTLEQTQNVPLMRYNTDPVRFPCIAIEVTTQYKMNGPDELIVLYLYDYTLEPGETPSEVPS